MKIFLLVTELLSANKAISALSIIVSSFSIIGSILSLMILKDFGLFYTLGVLYLGIYFLILMLILLFSIHLRKRVVCSFLHMTWVLCLKTQYFLNFLSSIGDFIKHNLYILGVDILVVYYQISLLLLVFEGFNTWFWFTTITIVLLPLISARRHRNNVMLTHNLFRCVEPLLFFLRSAVFLRFGCCMGLGSLFIPESACGTGEGLPTEGTGGDAPSEGSSINGDTCHTPIKRCLPDSAEASSSVLKRQRFDTTPSCSVLSSNNTPFLSSPVLREHVNFTGTGRLICLDSVCEGPIDRNLLPCATVVSILSSEQIEQIRTQQAGPISNASELGSDDGRMLGSRFHGSADTSPAKMSPEDPRKSIIEILGLPLAKVVHLNGQQAETEPDGLPLAKAVHLNEQQPEIVPSAQFRPRRLAFPLE